MLNTLAMTRRNVRIFLRDKAAVFFSVLSALMLIVLYFLFIADIYSEALLESAEITKKQADFAVYLQMMAGVLVLNSMSFSLGMFTVAAKDFESKRVSSFLITPLKKRELVIAYYIGGIILSLALNLLSWGVSVALVGVLTGYWVSTTTFFMSLLVLASCSLISSSFMLLLTVAARSSTALGVINAVAGTFFGFLCGIYIPLASLGSAVKFIGSILPFTHLTIWFKGIVLNDAFSQIGISGEAKDILFEEVFSANHIGFCGLNIPLWLILIMSAVLGALCIFIAGLLLKKRFKNA